MSKNIFLKNYGFSLLLLVSILMGSCLGLIFKENAAIEVKDRGIQAALWTPNGRTKIIDAGVGNISGCILGKSVRLESGSNLSYYSGCPDLDFGATALQLLSWQIKKGSYQLK